MLEASHRGLDRTGAVAGAAAVALLVAMIMVLPGLPGPDEPIDDIARVAADDRSTLLLGSYLGALMGGALLVFGAVIAAVIRRAEGAGGGWWVVALAGIAGTSIGIVGNALVASFVRAVEHGARGDVLWAGYSADHALGTLLAIPLAVFLLGTGLGARATGALPRWLAWAGIAVTAALVAGAGSIAGNELEGGPLGVPLFLGYVGFLFWIVSVSVLLWRRSAVVAATGAGEGLAADGTV